MWTYFEPFLKASIALFIIIDAPGSLPFFMGLTEGMTVPERRKIFSTAILTAFFLLIFFLFLGTAVLDLFNVTLDDFKIAGGILLIWIAIEIMLRGKINIEHKEDVGVVPLACPLLVGPGAITTSLVLLKLYGYGVVFSAILACFLLVWLILFFSEAIYGILGRNGSLILTKISAVLIASIAVLFIRQGITALFLVK